MYEDMEILQRADGLYKGTSVGFLVGSDCTGCGATSLNYPCPLPL